MMKVRSVPRISQYGDDSGRVNVGGGVRTQLGVRQSPERFYGGGGTSRARCQGRSVSPQ